MGAPWNQALTGETNARTGAELRWTHERGKEASLGSAETGQSHVVVNTYSGRA